MRARSSRPAIVTLVLMGALALGLTGASAANLDEDCGGAAGITCNSALWCQVAGGKCGVTDAPGKCEKAPAFCMAVSKPVCGCNGKTYQNDCERQKAKVKLDRIGACPKEPTAAEPKAKASKTKK